jgi:serine/threonine-protein kinase
MGGYRLEVRLGEGGQGTVYRARRGGRLYAIKFLPLRMEERAWRELEVRLRLRCLGTMRVEGCGHWPDRAPRFLYVVVPYVRGRPLYACVQENNPPARWVVHLMRELARQVEQVHQLGVVHRDIKGSNVLVRHEDERPVLVDFGLGTYPGATEITHPLTLVGTPRYRSPEALRFRKQHAGEHAPARASDDLWALGVVLYVLLTGSYPFDVEEGQDEGALADVILKQEPEPPHERNPRVPRALGELCLRMLEKRLEARYPDAVALGTALEGVLLEADATWDVPLCEVWGPEDATTPQEVALDFGEWRERLRRLAAYTRRHPRRGRPVALAEASTLPRTPEAPPAGGGEAGTEAGPAPRWTRAPRRRVLAWGGVLVGLGLLGWLVALGFQPRSEPEVPSTTPAVVSVPTIPEVRKSGQEVASPSEPPEVGSGAAPERAATPAPVASATPRKDSTRVKTPRKTLPRQQKQSTVLDTVGRACVLVWVAGELACATSPEPVVRPMATPPASPPTAECPAGSVETTREVGGVQLGGQSEVFFLIDDKLVFNQRITVPPGRATLILDNDFGRFPIKTVFIGQLVFGEERVYGFFTQARTPDGQTYSVCFDLYDKTMDLERGVPMKPGSRPDAAIIFSQVALRSVKRLE